MHADTEKLINAIDETLGESIQSMDLRESENPLSAVWHVVLSGHEYVLILQPTHIDRWGPSINNDQESKNDTPEQS